MVSLPVIERAKVVLMLQFRIDAETAFAVLSRVSQDTNIKVREIAALVCEVSGGDQRPDPGTDPVLAHVLDQLAAGSAPLTAGTETTRSPPQEHHRAPRE